MLHHTTYVKSENAPWVTFIHGAGGSSKIWFKQIKAFKQLFNVLLIDLRGHGKSKNTAPYINKYSFQSVTQDVIKVLDHLKIKESHFLGISLGTIIIRELDDIAPHRVKSMILAGAILRLNFRSQILMKLGYALHKLLPFILLYKLFAFIILPKKNHKPSRNLFIKEAKKLYKKEFIRWYKLTSDINDKLRIFRKKSVKTPSLFLMGAEDYMFLPSVQSFVDKNQLAKLAIVKDCGHIVNVQAATIFNSKSISFIHSIS